MRRLALAAAAGAFALALGCETSPPPRDPPLDATSPMEPGEEFALGRSVAARLSTGRELVVDERARAYVARVGGLVGAASARPDPYDGWRFYIVRDDRVATFSAPCGFVFVTTGALKASRDEDALAALLAQEMAHSALAHALDGEDVRAIRPTRESWPNAPEWGLQEFQRLCDAAAARATAGWTEPQEQAASEWARAALARAGYSDAPSPETRAKRFQQELQAVR